MTAEQLSAYRKRIQVLLKQIDRLSSRCLFPDPLIRGTPVEVMRTCGKQTCKCMKDPKDRHGPYKVIAVVKDGKQRSIPLGKDKQELWSLVQRYQFQIKKLSELKNAASELVDVVWEVIERRLQQFP
jgi:hypothetical protein